VNDRPLPGDLDVAWIHGSRSRRRRTDPPLQVHRYRDDTFIIRQSKDETFEAPFVFLLMGDEQALLLDTGAVDDDRLRNAVDAVVSGWLLDHPRDGYRLVVAHTHGHGDHVAGDPSFRGRDDTVLVDATVVEVCAFFGITSWPTERVDFDLGDRRLEIFGIPGHHPASIAVYDHRTGLLFTGDTVYPGRIYVRDVPAFVDSLDRLGEFAAERPVTHVLGCHIEMTRQPGRDYFPGCLYQPDEPPLQMTVDQLRAMRAAAASRAGHKGVQRFDDFVLYLGMGSATDAGLLLRGLAGRLRDIVRTR
jgi:hydroxyacylglutathione hydrolase